MAVVLCVLLVTLINACGPPPPNPEIQAVYDQKTGRLTQLTLDRDHNGKPDTWSYMDAARVLRIEIDGNADGLVDRWEHYGPGQRLEKVGFSRANDGKADAWAYQAPDGSIGRIEASTRRDGKVDRTEFYEKGFLVRVEEDTDADGRIDKWETYESGVLASVAFDTAHRGVPDRRLIYRKDGSLDRIETPAP